MRKFCKKLMLISTAAVMALGAGALSACDAAFVPPQGTVTGDVVSNGGFVVEKGDYVYFINGVQSYTSDNTYNKVVKSALQRVSKTELEKGNGAAQTVIPSLMTAGDHSSGFYIYGDKIYYTTPNNVKNTSGVVENDYLDFKSANLDGTGITSHFRTSSNSTAYRFVEVDTTVYAVYEDNSTLYSYNTATGKETTLATSVGEYVFSSSDKTDPYIYYTKEVVDGIDQDSPNALSYNQIYRVRADVTEETAPYKFEWDQDYLDEHDGEAPYVNLGEIVLDGIGAGSIVTEFTHDLKEGVTPATPNGYTYTLQSYANNGLYFTRTEIVKTGSDGEDGKLYFLSADKLGASWNSVSGNGSENMDVIAQDTTKASTAAIFYYETVAGKLEHHYIYVDGSTIKRVDVADGTEQRIAYNVSGATLMYLDNTSDQTYKYVYFNRSNGSGLSVERAVYNGTEKNYNNLGYDDNKPYQPVKLLNLQHASDWYNYEVINGRLYFADAEQFGANSYNYVASVDLTNADGKLMNNVEIEALNEKYEEITEFISNLGEDNGNLSKLYNCYFYTQSTEYYDANLKEIEDAGKQVSSYYSDETREAFAAYVAGTSDDAKKFADGEKSYRVYSYFVTAMGTRTQEDADTLADYWKAELEHYTAPATEEEILPWWAWMLIGIGCGLVVIGAGLAIFFVLRAKKNKAEKPVPQRMKVDTTDDRDIDVYNKDTEQNEQPAEAEEASEAVAEAPTEEQTEEAETAEFAEPVAEEPVELSDEVTEEEQPATEQETVAEAEPTPVPEENNQE